MAFNIDYLARVSTSANTGALKVWTYNATATGTNEAIATVVASAYFNAAQQVLTSGSEVGLLAVGDVFHVHGNDSNGMYVVSSITTDVTVGSYAAIGTVDTANIADDAVTADKLASNSVVTASIVDANVTLGKLAAGITPSHVVKYAGQPTTSGGAAAEAVTVTGAAATDLAFVQMVDDGTNNTTIINAVVTTNTLTVTFSADPGADAVINYQLLRAAS